MQAFNGEHGKEGSGRIGLSHENNALIDLRLFFYYALKPIPALLKLAADRAGVARFI